MGVLDNARQEKYAQELHKGLSQRKAYRVAFPQSIKWKDATVDKRASELYNTREILGRLQELKEATANEAIKTAIERKKWLSSIIDDEDEDTNTKLKACDLLNKMDGEYVTKVEADVKMKKLEDLI